MTSLNSVDLSSVTSESALFPTLDNNTLVLMFSGQGAQKPGMGSDLFERPRVAQTLECASDVLGWDVRDAIVNFPAEKLNQTNYAQPALCALSIGIARELEACEVVPAAVLGFSLGQVSALAVSGMLSVEDTFAFVKERAAYMDEIAHIHPGSMSAFLKITPDLAEEICEECAQGEVLVPANYNCPGQIVLSGATAAVERAEKAWIAQKGRCSRLATAGAFHSPLMQPAADKLASYLKTVAFHEARIPLICNTDAQPLSADSARAHLADHLTHPVRFEQSVITLAQAGATHFIEAGFGGVLSNLVRRIDGTLQRGCVQDAASFNEFVESWHAAN